MKKRTKKLLSMACCTVAAPWNCLRDAISKSFLLLCFKKEVLLFISPFALSGCSQTGPPETAAAVRLYRVGEGPATRIRDLGKVEGYYCKTTVIDAAGAGSRAVYEIKSRAFLQGANAIANFSCAVAYSADKCPDCWVCVQCEGQALTSIR